MKAVKTFRSLALAPVLAMIFATAALAAEHGFVSGLLHAEPKDNLFPVNIEQVNGKDAEFGPNHPAHVGSNKVLVSLVFNSEWGTGMSQTQGMVYSKTIELDVEKGKTYYIGAKVDTNASEEAQKDGSFWTPVVTEVH